MGMHRVEFVTKRARVGNRRASRVGDGINGRC